MKKTEGGQETYTLRLICGNCGNSFPEIFPFGVDAHRGNGLGEVLFKGNEPVLCPNCGSFKISKSW